MSHVNLFAELLKSIGTHTPSVQQTQTQTNGECENESARNEVRSDRLGLGVGLHNPVTNPMLKSRTIFGNSPIAHIFKEYTIEDLIIDAEKLIEKETYARSQSQSQSQSPNPNKGPLCPNYCPCPMLSILNTILNPKTETKSAPDAKTESVPETKTVPVPETKTVPVHVQVPESKTVPEQLFFKPKNAPDTKPLSNSEPIYKPYNLSFSVRGNEDHYNYYVILQGFDQHLLYLDINDTEIRLCGKHRDHGFISVHLPILPDGNPNAISASMSDNLLTIRVNRFVENTKYRRISIIQS